MRAAASSTASGRPSSVVTIAWTSGSVAVVSAKSGRTSRARCTNSSSASRPSSGATGYSCSPVIRRTSRLVTSTRSPGALRTRSATSVPAAGRSCSRLSRTRRSDRPRRWSCSDLDDRTVGELVDAEDGRDRGRDELGIPHRGELDEPGAVGETVADGTCRPDGEPCLAGPTGACQRQDPGRGEQRGDLAQLHLAADEGRDGLRQIGRDPQRAERPRVVGGTRHDQAMEPAGRVEVSQRMKALVLDPRVVGRRSVERVDHGIREQDLAAVGRRRDPCRVVDVDADVVRPVLGRRAEPGVQPDPHAERPPGVR